MLRYLLASVVASMAVAAGAQSFDAVDCSRISANDNPRLLPYLSFSTDVRQLPTLASGETRELAGLLGEQGYTRLKLQFVPCAVNAQAWRAYAPERRDWFNRLFAGKKVSKILAVKVNLTSPNVTTIHPVATIGRDSSRKAGEVWSTEVSNAIWLTPYFRVGRGSSANIDVSLAATTDYTSAVSTDLLDLLKRATGLISPSATLLSSLNQDRFNQAANFVDSSINSFFKQSVSERADNDFDVSRGNRPLAALYLRLPGANDTLEAPIPVGIWVISTDEIIASIFQPSADGHAFTSSSIPASSILNFRLTPDQTIGEALDTDSTVKLARDAFLKAPENQRQSTATALCHAVSVRSEGLNLTPVDVNAVLWAYPQSLPLDRSTTAYTTVSGACNPA